MNGPLELLKVFQDSRNPREMVDLYAALQKLRSPKVPSRFDDDMDSNGMCPRPYGFDADGRCGDAGFSASDTFSCLDSCTSPHSSYSPLSPPPLSCLSNRLNTDAEPMAKTPCSEETAVPVCYDYVQGRCVRNNCKYLHDSHQIEKTHCHKRGICFDYLRGDCNRGAMCRFSHDVSDFAQEYQMEDDISLAKVKRWGQGICFDFVRGACNRGCACPWSHNLLEIAVATKRGIENMSTSERNRIAGNVRQRLCSSLENKSEEDYKHRHEMSSAPPLSARSSTTVLSDWVPLWDYPANTFGPMDEFGRPLHWFTDETHTHTDI